MKSLLALVTLVLTALVFEEKARQIAGDARDAYGGAVNRVDPAATALASPCCASRRWRAAKRSTPTAPP